MQPDTFGPAPALVARANAPRGTVLLLHGQYADALANVKELALLRGAGFDAVGIDAPDHGRRFTEGRDERYLTDEQAALSEHIRTAADEFPYILDALVRRGFRGPFAVVGISLGAFTGWQALSRDSRLQSAALLLGSPVLPWEDEEVDPTPFVGRRILAMNGEHDAVVPHEPTRRLVAQLGPQAVFELLEETPHQVPEPRWWSAWGRIIRHLSS